MSKQAAVLRMSQVPTYRALSSESNATNIANFYINCSRLNYINCSRLNQNKNSFSRIGCKIWNSIPGNLRNLPKHIFTEKITILFQNLQVQDSYVDVEQINKQ